MRTSVIRETTNGLYQIGIEDVMFNDRKLYLLEEVTTESAMSLIKQLMYLESENPGVPITLYINSPGGSVRDGLAVYDYIQLMKSPVTTVCMGMAASMGAILFLSGKKRLMLKSSEVMIHDASFANAEFSGLKPDEIHRKTEDLIKTCEQLREIVVERTGLSSEYVKERMKTDSYFKAEEAIEKGLATGYFELV